MARHRNTAVTDQSGNKLELELKSETTTNEEILVPEGHRSHIIEGIDPFPLDKWKYYLFTENKPERCQKLEKSKENVGYAKGISFWYPHFTPKFLVDEATKNGTIVRCSKLTAENDFSDKFALISDGKYIFSINNVDITFEHYLLTLSEIVTACTEITNLDCDLKCGGLNSDFNDFDMNSCDIAVGAEFAAQQSLKMFAEDSNNDFSDRIDAVLLYAWLGSLEGSIDELYSLKPWAVDFILKAMTQYGPAFARNDSNYLMNYGNAYVSETIWFRRDLEECLLEFSKFHETVLISSKGSTG